jgi:hypothetical protein
VEPDQPGTELVHVPQPVWVLPEHEEQRLPALRVVGGVIAARLRDPRTLLAALTGVATFFYLLGRRVGRRRW